MNDGIATSLITVIILLFTMNQDLKITIKYAGFEMLIINTNFYQILWVTESKLFQVFILGIHPPTTVFRVSISQYLIHSNASRCLLIAPSPPHSGFAAQPPSWVTTTVPF